LFITIKVERYTAGKDAKTLPKMGPPILVISTADKTIVPPNIALSIIWLKPYLILVFGI
jgi:hypothetical protein